MFPAFLRSCNRIVDRGVLLYLLLQRNQIYHTLARTHARRVSFAPVGPRHRHAPDNRRRHAHSQASSEARDSVALLL